MNKYYKEKLEQGQEYQDFVSVVMIEKLKIPLSFFGSKKYQYGVGENQQGIEIKFDDRLEETGNLYIEVAEKTKAENQQYISSGVMRNDNTWLYLIGNYNEIFIFDKKILKRMYLSRKHKEVEIPTSKGFLLKREVAKEWAANHINCRDIPRCL